MGTKTSRAIAVAALAAAGAAAVTGGRAATKPPADDRAEDAGVAPLPPELADTGIHRPGVRPFAPQYPLWTDGATKRRFVYLPPGTSIDARDPEAWDLPVGAKLWKELSFGRPVETRYVERTREGYRFATYVWSEDGTRATLAPPHATRSSASVGPGLRHEIPGRSDCLVCHGNGRSPLLGFSAIQLSADRDPKALHAEPLPEGALGLRELVAEGRLRGFAGTTAPRIEAEGPNERAALGYLHANCGGCHREDGPLASLGLVLASPAGQPRAVLTSVDRPSRIAPDKKRVAWRAADESVLLDRMRTREPAMQMPPLGTQTVDHEAVSLITRWIEERNEGDRR